MKQLHFEETISAKNGVLDVDVDCGHVEIVAAEGTAVTITAEVENSHVTVNRVDNTVYVRARRDHEETKGISWLTHLLNGGRQNKVHLTIRVPAHCEIKAKTVTGHLLVNGVDAAVTARLTTGKATLANISGPIYAKLVTGKLLYEGVLSNADHRFETTTGAICLRLRKEPNAHLDAATTTGSVQCNFPLSGQKQQNFMIGRRLRGVLGSGEGHIKARIVTGSFQLEHA